MKIKRICLWCNKTFEIFPSYTIGRNGHVAKFCSSICYHIYARGKKTKPCSKETKRKIGFANRGKQCWFKGKKRPKEFSENLSKMRKRDKNPMWKGGIKKQGGYIAILNPAHPFCDKCGYIKRARLVMENKLKRYLSPKEIVHHIDKNTYNDNPENLMLFATSGEHTKFHWKLYRNKTSNFL